MKVVILAGGMGTRLSEETDLKPKPMVEIGSKPILWHIMKTYSFYGFNDFIVCLGYKGYLIKEFFINYFFHQSDLTINLKNNKIEIHNCKAEPWSITLVDTGLKTMTGGRIKRIKSYLNNETFMLTYGDGVGNIKIPELIDYHKKHGKYATVTAVQPTGRFGALNMDKNNNVLTFIEKPKGDSKDDDVSWINAGFFVLEPKILDYIKDDDCFWEREPLENIAKDNNLKAYKHFGFWRPMDTLRDKNELENYWNSGKAEWKIWND